MGNSWIIHPYNPLGRLTQQGSTSYTYDALGRLTQQGGTSYTYNGDGVLVGRGSTTYTQDLVAPLEQVLHDGSTNLVYGLARIRRGTGVWHQHDGLGSVRAVLDGAGAVQSTTSYDPWGTPQTPLADSFGFTGELHDGDLVHLRARWCAIVILRDDRRSCYTLRFCETTSVRRSSSGLRTRPAEAGRAGRSDYPQGMFVVQRRMEHRNECAA